VRTRHRGRGFGRPPGGGEPQQIAARARGDVLHAFPDRLRQRRTGVEHEAHALHHDAREFVVGFQNGREHRQPVRHVEVHRRLGVAQVAHRLVDQPRHRAAFVDVERATVAQHQIEVVVATERVAPGQPVDQHGLLAIQEAPHLPDHLLVGAQHAVGVDHDLGRAGGARSQQVLGVVVGLDGLERLHHLRPFGGACQAREIDRPRHRRGTAAVDHRCLHAAGRDRRPVHRGVGRVHQCRAQGAQDARQLGVVRGGARVGARHRAGLAADVHGRERQQRVVDGVVRQDDDGLPRGQLHVEQALRDGADLRAHLAPREAAPVAARIALGQRKRLGRFTRPAFHPLADAAGIGAQRLGRAQHGTAIGQRFTHSSRRGEHPGVVEKGSHAVSGAACNAATDLGRTAASGAMVGRVRHSRERGVPATTMRIARGAARACQRGDAAEQHEGIPALSGGATDRQMECPGAAVSRGAPPRWSRCRSCACPSSRRTPAWQRQGRGRRWPLSAHTA